jgi:adenylylsulfate kinase
MVYWFTGQPGAGKTVLGKKLHKFLETEKRNWRKNVFHLDGDNLRDITNNKDYSEEGRKNNIRTAQTIVEYLHLNRCDIVVSLVAPFIELREELKDKIGPDMVEIFVHTTESRERDHFHVKDYEPPQVNFIDINTTKDSPDISFSKLINHLNKLKKL